ncbi:MAG: NAD-dependent epimerase/dehydratase family protein [Steroidobacteraceae bacterium]
MPRSDDDGRPPNAFAYAFPMQRTCLIVGCGYVGRRLARRPGPGSRIIALVRSTTSAATLHADGVETMTVDLDEAVIADALRGAARGAAIVYLAPPPDTGSTDARMAGFLAALGDVRPAVLLYVSTTGVYGDAGGALVTEATPVAPGNDRSRRRVDAETMAAEWCSAQGTRCVILRVPGIYGPGRLPIERLQRGEPALRPEDAGPGNRIHVDDLVSACRAALERPVVGVFNVGDGNHASTTTYLQRVAALANLPPPRLVSMEEARATISPGLLAFLVESRRIDNRRMLGELGVRLAYADLDAGIAASLAEMRPG